jgi:hypothetical protein
VRTDLARARTPPESKPHVGKGPSVETILVTRKLFAEILTQAQEDHPRPHYQDPFVPCGGPGLCVDEVNFAAARKLLAKEAAP